MAGRGGVARFGGAGSWCSTPHLTSPLEGGRDELGKGVGVGWVGSCLRRNDGEGRGDDGGLGVGDRGVARFGGAGSWRSTPHLTSPLKGGRDELGKGVGVERD